MCIRDRLEAEYLQLQEDKATTWPESSIASHMYFGIENTIVLAALEPILEQSYKHLSLHHDGFRLDYATVKLVLVEKCPENEEGPRTLSQEDPNLINCFCELLNKTALTKTGYNVEFIVKKREYFIDILQKKGKVMGQKELPQILTNPGRSIFTALYHLADKEQELLEKVRCYYETTPNNSTQEPPLISYRQVCEAVDVPVKATMTLGLETNTKWLIHIEKQGNAQCLPLQILPDGECNLWFGDITLSLIHISEPTRPY